MGLPKSIIAKYGMTKKAWAVFRKSKKSKGGSKRKRRAHKRRVHAHKKNGTPARIHNNGGTKMAKRRGRKRAAVRHAARRVKAAMDTRPGKVMIMAAEAAAGGVVTSLIVNKLPVVKDQSRTMKSIGQVGLGLASIFFIRNRHVKSLGAGAVIAGVMGLAKEVLKVEPLAGPAAGSRTLTPTEMKRVLHGMNMPLPGQTLNVPLSSAPANAGFNRGGFGS